MIWDSNVIKTMGLIAQEVYDDSKKDSDGNRILQYFIPQPQAMIVNGITYNVLDSTGSNSLMGDSSIDGFQALLLQKSGTEEYVVAFRGTDSITDAIVDGLAGLTNANAQYLSAYAFVQKALHNKDHTITINNLTLTGHSLGGILTQQVGAKLGIKGYTYNPWGSNALVKYPINGTLNVLARVLEAAGVYTSSAESFAKNNINIRVRR